MTSSHTTTSIYIAARFRVKGGVITTDMMLEGYGLNFDLNCQLNYVYILHIRWIEREVHLGLVWS
jgi:hypothetical protein